MKNLEEIFIEKMKMNNNILELKDVKKLVNFDAVKGIDLSLKSGKSKVMDQMVQERQL